MRAKKGVVSDGRLRRAIAEDVAHGGGLTWRGRCWRGKTSRTVRRRRDLKRWGRAGRRNGGPGGGGRWGGTLPWWVWVQEGRGE